MFVTHIKRGKETKIVFFFWCFIARHQHYQNSNQIKTMLCYIRHTEYATHTYLNVSLFQHHDPNDLLKLNTQVSIFFKFAWKPLRMGSYSYIISKIHSMCLAPRISFFCDFMNSFSLSASLLLFISQCLL